MSTEDMNKKEWLKEFSEFIESASEAAPRQLGERIRDRVHSDLNPGPRKVFFKTGLIQVVVGFVVLLFCPQFGLSLSGLNGIMHLMMRFGEGGCMFGCGALFVGSSLLVSSLVLSPEEVRLLRRNRSLQAVFLSLLAMGAFLCLGAEVLQLLTLAWLAGSVLGGLISLELGWMARRWVRAKVIYG